MAANYQNIRKLSKKGKKTRRERPEYEYSIKVTRVLDGKYGILFDVELNHVTIYGCRLCETKEGAQFIGFPQQRDKKDPNKWWSIAWAPLTDDQVKIICDQISEQLSDDEEDEEVEDE